MIDYETLRRNAMERFAKTLAYLAKTPVAHTKEQRECVPTGSKLVHGGTQAEHDA